MHIWETLHIDSFLPNGPEAVTLTWVKTCPVGVTSGVPQKYVLGLLFFLILTGDIGHRVGNAFLSNFADSTKVLKVTITQADVQDLQIDLDVIYQRG